MHQATKPIALGERFFKVGDTIPASVLDSLPAGRVEALRAQRYICIQSEAGIATTVAQLCERVKALEARLSQCTRSPKNRELPQSDRRGRNGN